MEENKYKDDEQVKENIRKYKENLVQSEIDIDKKEINNKEDKIVEEYKEKEKFNKTQLESNNNNNYCPNCGVKLRENINFCTKCGYKINQPIVINKINPKDYNIISLSICTLSAICLVIFIYISLITVSYVKVNNILFLLPLIGLMLMIIARVKYPTYTFGEVLMWIYLIIIYLDIWIMFMLTICGYLIYSCAG